VASKHQIGKRVKIKSRLRVNIVGTDGVLGDYAEAKKQAVDKAPDNKKLLKVDTKRLEDGRVHRSFIFQ
jgi:hypothetical protein